MQASSTAIFGFNRRMLQCSLCIGKACNVFNDLAGVLESFIQTFGIAGSHFSEILAIPKSNQLAPNQARYYGTSYMQIKE
jgi:hypothetical protein